MKTHHFFLADIRFLLSHEGRENQSKRQTKSLFIIWYSSFDGTFSHRIQALACAEMFPWRKNETAARCRGLKYDRAENIDDGNLN